MNPDPSDRGRIEGPRPPSGERLSPSGERLLSGGKNRRKNSSNSSLFRERGREVLLSRFTFVLMLTTAGALAFTNSVKSGSSTAQTRQGNSVNKIPLNNFLCKSFIPNS
jgi:preprotein translocase subunit SecG